MTPRRFRLTRSAVRDLEAIWEYIANDSPTAADGVLDSLYERLVLLGKNPLLGEGRRELQPGMRSFSVGNHVIYYQPTGKHGILVVRVLHGARDVRSEF